MMGDKIHRGVPADHFPKGGGVYRFHDPVLAAMAAVASATRATMSGFPQVQVSSSSSASAVPINVASPPSISGLAPMLPNTIATAAAQTALFRSYLAVFGGINPIDIPPGDYYFNDHIILPSNITLRGYNVYGTKVPTGVRFFWNTLGSGLILSNDPDGVQSYDVSGLSLFQTNNANQGVGMDNNGCWHGRVHDLFIGDGAANGKWAIGYRCMYGLENEVDKVQVNLSGTNSALAAYLFTSDDQQVKNSIFAMNNAATPTAGLLIESAAFPHIDNCLGLQPAGVPQIILNFTRMGRISNNDCEGSAGIVLTKTVPAITGSITENVGVVLGSNVVTDANATDLYLGRKIQVTFTDAGCTAVGTTVTDAAATAAYAGMNVAGAGVTAGTKILTAGAGTFTTNNAMPAGPVTLTITGFASGVIINSVTAGVGFTTTSGYLGQTATQSAAMTFLGTGGANQLLTVQNTLNNGVNFQVANCCTSFVSIQCTSNTNAVMYTNVNNCQSFLSILDKPNGANGLTDGTRATGSHNVILDNAPSQLLSTVTFTIQGNLSVATQNARLYLPQAATLVGVTASVGTAPATNPVTVDVLKNGGTIFTTGAHKPSIAAAANVSTSTNGGSNGECIPDVTAYAAGDYLQVGVTAIGTGTVGADLTVTIRYYMAGA